MPFLTSPAGNLMWIWQLSQCESGNLDGIIQRAQANAVATIAIKAFDGEWRYDRPTQYSRAIIDRLHQANISVAAWYYSVGNWQGPVDGDTSGNNIHNCTVAAELDNLDWAMQQGADFAIIDPEKEWCLTDQKADPAGAALAYGDALRRRFPRLPFYAGTVPSTSGYWVGNPLQQLAQYVDGFCPQVYAWSWGVNVRTWTDKAIGLAFGKPVYPIYESSSGAPQDYLVSAAAYAQQKGCQGVSWWSWQHANGDEWAGIGRAGQLFAPLAQAALAAQTIATVPGLRDDANAWHDPRINDKWIVQPILDAWRAKGGVAVCGYPLEGMTLDGDNVYRQVFENVMLEVPVDGSYQRFGGLGQRYEALKAKAA